MSESFIFATAGNKDNFMILCYRKTVNIARKSRILCKQNPSLLYLSVI